jgi:hypothetical protein
MAKKVVRKQTCVCRVEGLDYTFIVPTSSHDETCYEAEENLKAKFGKEVECEPEWFGWYW